MGKKRISTKLIPDAALMCRIFQEKPTVETNSQRLTITAIFATDPSNALPWSVIFESTATKQI